MRVVGALVLCSGKRGCGPAELVRRRRARARELRARAAAGLGEEHRRAEVHEFMLALLASPRFGRLVDDVVVEFGNALHQPLMDEVIDALLYLGPEEHLVAPSTAIYHEGEYADELRRRAAILKEVYGMDFLPELEELLAQDAGAKSHTTK